MDRFFCSIGIHCWGEWVEYGPPDSLLQVKRLRYEDQYRICQHCGKKKYPAIGGPGMA